MKKTDGKARKTKGDKAGQLIKRLWGSLPVVDAENDLRVFICKEDLAKATPKDPGACVFARACQRVFGASKVLIFRSIAYVELPTQDGTRRVERFELSPGMRDLVEKFDLGETVIPEAGFLLKKPRVSMKFEYKRRMGKGNVAAQKERARKRAREKLLGTRLDKYRDEPLVIDIGVRSGSGAVHFTPPTSSQAE